MLCKEKYHCKAILITELIKKAAYRDGSRITSDIFKLLLRDGHSAFGSIPLFLTRSKLQVFSQCI